ncbi:MAG: hypothetical protein WCL44_02780 [bacterium]
MGSSIEINDTLKLRRGAGFPSPVELNGVYSFSLPGRRLFHLTPVRVFLVEEIDGKWNFVGHAQILEQTVDAVREETRGVFRVVSLYPPEHVRMLNQHDSPAGRGYGTGP